MKLTKIQRQLTLAATAFTRPCRSPGCSCCSLPSFCLCAPLANAQLAGKGEIKGVVTDATGAVVPGATVTATSTTQGTKFTRYHLELRRLQHHPSQPRHLYASPLPPRVFRPDSGKHPRQCPEVADLKFS